LPVNTFFTTPKKTYILAITKKEDKSQKQEKPVFTYLVSDI
jgi:type I restriction-modification system DNA methylase subunit